MPLYFCPQVHCLPAGGRQVPISLVLDGQIEATSAQGEEHGLETRAVERAARRIEVAKEKLLHSRAKSQEKSKKEASKAAQPSRKRGLAPVPESCAKKSSACPSNVGAEASEPCFSKGDSVKIIAAAFPNITPPSQGYWIGVITKVPGKKGVMYDVKVQGESGRSCVPFKCLEAV